MLDPYSQNFSPECKCIRKSLFHLTPVPPAQSAEVLCSNLHETATFFWTLKDNAAEPLPTTKQGCPRRAWLKALQFFLLHRRTGARVPCKLAFDNNDPKIHSRTTNRRHPWGQQHALASPNVDTVAGCSCWKDLAQTHWARYAPFGLFVAPVSVMREYKSYASHAYPFFLEICKRKTPLSGVCWADLVLGFLLTVMWETTCKQNSDWNHGRYGSTRMFGNEKLQWPTQGGRWEKEDRSNIRRRTALILGTHISRFIYIKVQLSYLDTNFKVRMHTSIFIHMCWPILKREDSMSECNWLSAAVSAWVNLFFLRHPTEEFEHVHAAAPHCKACGRDIKASFMNFRYDANWSMSKGLLTQQRLAGSCKKRLPSTAIQSNDTTLPGQMWNKHTLRMHMTSAMFAWLQRNPKNRILFWYTRERFLCEPCNSPVEILRRRRMRFRCPITLTKPFIIQPCIQHGWTLPLSDSLMDMASCFASTPCLQHQDM